VKAHRVLRLDKVEKELSLPLKLPRSFELRVRSAAASCLLDALISDNNAFIAKSRISYVRDWMT